jgi:hypothetical protein
MQVRLLKQSVAFLTFADSADNAKGAVFAYAAPAVPDAAVQM